MPKWVQPLLDENKKITRQNEEFAREKGIEFPVTRYPGMGEDRIRKRKVPISREFKFKIEHN